MKIAEFQNLFKDHLNEVESLVQGGCAAFAEDSLDIANEVETRLATAHGVAIVITTPEFRRNGCASSGIPVEAVLAVKCLEIPTSNRAEPGHLTALDAAEIVAHEIVRDGVQFGDIRQTVDRASGVLTVTVNFNVCIHLT